MFGRLRRHDRIQDNARAPEVVPTSTMATAGALPLVSRAELGAFTGTGPFRDARSASPKSDRHSPAAAPFAPAPQTQSAEVLHGETRVPARVYTRDRRTPAGRISKKAILAQAMTEHVMRAGGSTNAVPLEQLAAPYTRADVARQNEPFSSGPVNPGALDAVHAPVSHKGATPWGSTGQR